MEELLCVHKYWRLQSHSNIFHRDKFSVCRYWKKTTQDRRFPTHITKALWRNKGILPLAVLQHGFQFSRQSPLKRFCGFHLGFGFVSVLFCSRTAWHHLSQHCEVHFWEGKGRRRCRFLHLILISTVMFFIETSKGRSSYAIADCYSAIRYLYAVFEIC